MSKHITYTAKYVEQPPSPWTIALHEKGWIWNLDWTWTDPETGKRCTIFQAMQREKR